MAKKSTEAILKKLAKKLPEGSFYTLDEQEKYEVIPTGISSLDYALGTGGFARGWQHMIFGPSSAGKSALVLTAIGNWQKENPDSLCCVIDLEKSCTPEWTEKFGVDNSRLVIIRPTTSDEMVTMTMQAIEANAFDIIMVDSLGAGLLQSEIDNDKTRMAGSAGTITRMVKAINSAFISLERDIKIDKDNGGDGSDFIVPTVILINQVRTNLASMYGEDTYSGGKALTHMMGTITQLRVSKASGDKIMGTVDGNQMRVGWMCNATINKNKLAVPGKAAGYTFVFKECSEHEFGIDNIRSIVDLALTLGIARIEGKSIYFPNVDGEEDKVVGRNNFQKRVSEDEVLRQFFAEEITRIMSDEATDEDLEVVKKLATNPDDIIEEEKSNQ